MRVDLFDFHLPPERIALRPAAPRDSARMLVLNGGETADHVVSDLPSLLRAGDCLVFSALTVHGSGGNTTMTHRRAALSTRWLGDDAVWDPRPTTATYYYDPEGPGLKAGDQAGITGENEL